MGKVIRFITNWMHEQGKWLTYLASAIVMGVSIWFTSQIPGMSAIVVVYGLLVGGVLVVAIHLMIILLEAVIPEAWLYKILVTTRKIKNSIKGGF